MAGNRNPPPGWYDNPSGEGNLRYWSGKKWLDQVRDKTAAEADGPSASLVTRPTESNPAQTTPSTVAPGDRSPDVLWEALGKPITGIGAGKYRLTSHYLFFEKGALRTDLQQVPVAALLDVDVRQSMAQKARGVGTVLVHIQRATRIEIVALEDIPNFREGQRAINEAAHAARVKIQSFQNTSTVNYQGSPPTFHGAAPVQSAPPETVAAVDYVSQLEKLGQLRDSGILTDEEFQAKKVEILRRM
jgi:hypothetical protein